jgi:hypothetical protein
MLFFEKKEKKYTIFSIRLARAVCHGGMAFRATGVTSLSRKHIVQNVSPATRTGSKRNSGIVWAV